MTLQEQWGDRRAGDEVLVITEDDFGFNIPAHITNAASSTVPKNCVPVIFDSDNRKIVAVEHWRVVKR